MITPGFSLTATERVLPKLALDFTTASLDARVTFTRTTDATHPATYVNSSGVLTTATNNQPRFDYDPVTLTCKGLLIEESRANLYPNSNFGTGWAPAPTATIVAAQATGPDGTLSGSLLYPTSTGTFRYVAQATVGYPWAVSSTLSFYAKNAGMNFVSVINTTGASLGVSFNLTTGAVNVVGSSMSGTCTNAGNGWWRCTVSSSAGYSLIFPADSNSTTTATANGTNGVYLYGAQLEAGAFATSYIPTTVLSLTRNADEASMSGTNFTDWWNSTANTIEFQYQTTLSGSATGNRYIGCVAKDATNFIEICGKSTAAKTIVYQSIAGSFDVSLTGATSIFTNTYNKLIVAMQANNYGFALNSTSQGTDTSCALLSSPTSFEIGRWKEGASYGGYFCGWVQKINAYPQRLTASELSAFTAG